MQPAPSDLVDALFAPALAYKQAAIDAIQARFDEVAPLLIARLEAICAKPTGMNDPLVYGQIYTAYLLGSHQVEAAHDVLCALLRLDGAVLEAGLGDVLTDAGAGFLAFTAGGRVDGIKRIIEDRSAYLYSRGPAGEALALMAATGQIEPEPVRAYLASFLTAEWHDGDFIEMMAGALIGLRPEGYESALLWALGTGLIDGRSYDGADIQRAVSMDWPACQAHLLERFEWRAPAQLHAHLRSWAFARAEAERRAAQARKVARAVAAQLAGARPFTISKGLK